MAGEITGTAIVLNNTTGAIVGQGDFTHTFGGAPVEIGNKSYGDNVVYLDGVLQNKQHVFSGTLTYNNDTQFQKSAPIHLVARKIRTLLPILDQALLQMNLFLANSYPLA